MLNILWPVFIIISVIYGIINGKINDINSGIFESLESAVELSITFLGTISLWNGIMEIAKNTTLINKLTNMLKPLVKRLFPELKNNIKANQEISINLIANILGLGNAATPLGIKAMKTMQESNDKKEELSNSMMMFILLNTASLQLIPTNVIAIRTSLDSNNPTSIIIPVWVSSIVAALVGIFFVKILIRRKING
jgi:spore maturation protein A